MKNIKFYKKGNVNKQIEHLCRTENKSTKFYCVEIDGLTIYVVDNLDKKLGYQELIDLYHLAKKEKAIFKKVLKNIPEIEISFDIWSFDNEEYDGSYFNPNYELEGDGFRINCALDVKDNGEICITDIHLHLQDGEMALSDHDYNKLKKQIKNQILI